MQNLLAANAKASYHKIVGKVIDSKTNQPLEGVTVYNKTSSNFTTTNFQGNFAIDNISEGDTLVIQNVGYETTEVIITQENLDQALSIELNEAAVSLDQVVLSTKIDPLTTLVNIDVENNPVRSAQEILRRVPGLIIGQHAGGGKAEQLFLRGFDIDHGTDVAIDVDGLPVNLVSHAHGQGYSDLHFVIPETIKNIDFGKGPYYADKGNFNTAGYVGLQTKRTIDENYVAIEAGQFNTIRNVNLIKLLDSDKSNAYFASELVLTDGVFESPQDFNRLNLLGRYNFNNFDGNELTVSISHFQSKWNASGQIPQRAVDQGIISRFGALDDTEGGITSRSNIWVNHRKELGENKNLTSKLFLSKYDFELFSNFTFFLESFNGDRPEGFNDQIAQRESRTIIGGETIYDQEITLSDKDASLDFKGGVGFRYDDVNDVELSKTQNRRYRIEAFENLGILNLGDVDETNVYGFASASYRKNKWTINPTLRLDYFNFQYVDDTSELFDARSDEQVIASPKLNIFYSPSSDLQLFAKSGFGFHSNDSRVVVASRQEILEDNPDATITDVDTLPTAFGVDLGTIWKPTNKLILNATLWGLNLQQEFVYVGDAAVVEPSGRSRRLGVEVGGRYQINDWLYANVDANYTVARSIDEPDGQDFIPLAPDFTSAGGLSVTNLGDFSGGINYRYIDDRPANEDNSIVAIGYFVTDMNLNYNFAKNWTIGLIVENLFDVEWNETQFATETLIRDINGNLETEPVEEITFTPGTPFFARLKLSVNF